MPTPDERPRPRTALRSTAAGARGLRGVSRPAASALNGPVDGPLGGPVGGASTGGLSPRHHLTQGLLLRHRRQHTEAIAPLMQAAQAARDSADAPLWVRCELALGRVLAELGETDGAQLHLQRARDGADQLDDAVARREAREGLAQLLMDSEQTEAAEQAWTALATEAGAPPLSRARAWHQLGRCLIQAGRHAEALSPLHEALSRWADAPQADIPAALWRDLGLALAHTGSSRAAGTALQNALQLSRRRQDLVEQARSLHALGLAAELSDQLDTAGSLAEHSLRLARQAQALPEQHAACALLLHVHRRRSHLVACLACSDELRAVEQQWQRETMQRRMQALNARLALHESRQRAEMEALQQGELQRVQEQLRQTHRSLSLALAALAQAPQAGHGATGPNPLSPREREVLALLAEGLSNPAAARRLGLSAVTVRHHVSAILDKLGVRSRTEAVTLAGRRGWM